MNRGRVSVPAQPPSGGPKPGSCQRPHSAALSGSHHKGPRLCRGIVTSSPVDLTLAGGVFVNSCNNYACINNQTPTPWSTNLNVTAIPNFDLGTASLNATQTGDYVIRLGPTTLTVTLSPSTAQQFYNNVVIPVSNDLNQLAGELRNVGIDSSVAGLAALKTSPDEALELFQIEGELLSQARYLGNAPSANNLQPFVDPPLTLPSVTPTDGLTSLMITNFEKVELNIAREVNLIATETQLGSELQVAVASPS